MSESERRYWEEKVMNLREHLQLAVDHIAALTGALDDLASLGATVAICGTKYDDTAARKVLGPNVRAKLAPTVGRQARTGENVPRTASPGLVARRWGSA